MGGAEMELAKLLSCSDRTRFQHCVVSLIDEGIVARIIRAQGIAVYSLGMKRSAPSFFAIWKLWKIIQTERPLILHTWLYHADLLGLLVAKLARVRFLAWNVRCSFVDMQYYPRLSKLVLKTLCLLSSIPDVVIANSQAGRQDHIRLGYSPRRFEVIPNGFAMERFHPDPSARDWLINHCGLPTSAITVGLIARYDPMKDQANFIAAAKEVSTKYADTYFILCGRDVDGNNTELNQLILRHRLLPYVRLLGAREDIHRIMAGLDIACSSSAFGEGFCNAIGEAMACGVPCVVTDTGDSAEIVGKTGKVVRPRDSKALANAIGEFIELGSEARKKIGLEARLRIREHFDIGVMAARYAQLYLSLCDTTVPQVV
jgi:glycosyltransferase involved in cell wall biosynthesis